MNPDPSNPQSPVDGSMPNGENLNINSGTVSGTNLPVQQTPPLAVMPVQVVTPNMPVTGSAPVVNPPVASTNPQPNVALPSAVAFNPEPIVPIAGMQAPVVSSPVVAVGPGLPVLPTTPLKTPKSKKLVLGALLALLIVAGSLGTVFGLYLPNKPSNVYQTGLARSGDALDKIVNDFTTKESLKKLENSEINASATFKSGEVSFNGQFGAKLSKTKSDGSLDVHIKTPDEADKTLMLKFLSDFPPAKKFPSIYFQVSGLKDLGLDAFMPQISAYEGKWIAVDSDYLESLAGPSASGFKNKENITSDEVAALIKTITKTSNAYLLTDDKNKAVLENKEFVGKEKTDNILTYHYKVGINGAHAKDYCKALSEDVLNSEVAKKMLDLDDKSIAEAKKQIPESCNKQVDELTKDDPDLELWIDAKYKLIHKLRIYDQQDKTAYAEIGQTYNGGSDINFFTAYHSEKSKADAKFSIDLDTKSNTSKGKITWAQKDNMPFDGQITFDAKPYSGEVKADMPAGAVRIQEILKKYGYDPATSYNTPGTQPSNIRLKAMDTERTTDIKALHGQVEAYYAQNGYYPGLNDLNSAAWRSKNMRGLDQEALKDPLGTTYTLVIKPSANQYGYTPEKCNPAGTQCQTYTLATLLSTGNTYTKTSLN